MSTSILAGHRPAAPTADPARTRATIAGQSSKPSGPVGPDRSARADQPAIPPAMRTDYGSWRAPGLGLSAFTPLALVGSTRR